MLRSSCTLEASLPLLPLRPGKLSPTAACSFSELQWIAVPPGSDYLGQRARAGYRACFCLGMIGTEYIHPRTIERGLQLLLNSSLYDEMEAHHQHQSHDTPTTNMNQLLQLQAKSPKPPKTNHHHPNVSLTSSSPSPRLFFLSISLPPPSRRKPPPLLIHFLPHHRHPLPPLPPHPLPFNILPRNPLIQPPRPSIPPSRSLRLDLRRRRGHRRATPRRLRPPHHPRYSLSPGILTAPSRA